MKETTVQTSLVYPVLLKFDVASMGLSMLSLLNVDTFDPSDFRTIQ